MNGIKRRAQERLKLHLRTRYDRITVVGIQGMFNYQCHKNSVNYVMCRSERDLQVVECIYIDNGDPILHYLVYHAVQGVYMDVTLGLLMDNYPEVYKIRTIDRRDYMSIDNEFERALDSWKFQFVHPLLRWAVDRIV